MKADDPQLKPQYRMPRVFGAMPGPRNVPRDKQGLANHQRNMQVAITARTDADALQEILPPRCTIDGAPLVTLSTLYMRNIGWLAGRGYALISVNIPIVYDSPSRGRLTGNFLPVVWENLADPILTGREELGWSKLFADIPDPVILGDGYEGSAGWDGFRFFDFAVEDCREAPAHPVTPIGSFHYKYVPKTGALTEADVDYLEFAAPGAFATGYGGMIVERRLVGQGRFGFHRARWEDLPFQYPIINALADLPLIEWCDASITYSRAEGTIGDPGGGALARID